MPIFVKSLAFWQAFSIVVAALVAQFLPQFAFEAAKLEAVILAVLFLFGVQPELRARGLL